MRKLLVLILLFLPVVCQAEWIPIVNNPGFQEIQADGSPSDWQFFSEGAGTGRCEFVAEGSSRYVRVTRDTGGDYTGVRQRLDEYAVHANSEYEIHGQYSSPVDGLAHPCVYYLNENGQFLGAYEFSLPTATERTHFSRRFRPHPATKRFEIQLRAQGKPGDVRFYSCDILPGMIPRSRVDFVKSATDLIKEQPSARCAVLNTGADLTVVLLAATGLELRLDSAMLRSTSDAEKHQPVFVDGQAIEFGGRDPEVWMRVCEPRDGRVMVRIPAPQSGFQLFVHIRPVKGERLKPLSVEFGGWENGNFAPKAQWIGDSEKLIGEDVDLALAEMMQSLTDGGKHPYIVMDSLTKPIKADIVRRYVLGEETPAQRVSLRAARGESEAFQIAILPDADGKARVSDVECSDLTGLAGKRIPASTVKVYHVGYVDTPWGERIPDPLFTDLKMGDPKDPVVLMADIRVPKDAVHGDYRGNLRVTVNGKQVSVPIGLAVWDFAVPEENHLRTCFWFFRGQIKRHYGMDRDPSWREYAPYLDMSLRYRLTPVDCNEGNVEPLFQVYREADGSFSIDWTEFDRFAEYILARGANVLHLAPTQWFGKWFSADLKGAYNPETFTDRATGKPEPFTHPYLSDEHKKMLQWYLREACDHFEKKGWLKYAYLQPFDEVGENPEVLSILKTCQDADPRVKILMDVLRPGDSKPMTELIDIWCPLSPNLPGGGFDEVRKRGDEVWWYVCIGPKKPYANLFTNWSVPEHRQLFWQSWKYRAEGLLYWGNNFWNWWDTEKPYDKATAWPAGKWSSSTTSSDTIGDGYFIYPGPDGPLPSLRLQAMLDGIEDYEYLWLLNDLVKKAEAKGVPASELVKAKELLTVPESFCKSLTEYSTKPEDLASLREQVAREIERLSKRR